MKKILAINGSTKSNSTNHIILSKLQSMVDSHVRFEIMERLHELPYFNPDLDTETPPDSIVGFRKQIESADVVLFCTPEYVFSLPGVLKNALEWCVSTTIFSDKPVAIIVAAAHGAKALESLQLILTTIQCRIIDNAVLLIQGAKGKIKPDGNVDQELEEKLRVLVRAVAH